MSIQSVGSVRSVSCVWLNETNQMNQTDQIDLSHAAFLRMAALTELKLPLYPVPVPTS